MSILIAVMTLSLVSLSISGINAEIAFEALYINCVNVNPLSYSIILDA
ncbi:MAG: hypothetical protein NDF58_06385 [archaeon YNP-LCB-024-027]|nr:hypothetical protein [Candidatus Culexarchaeum yellowstonense]